MHFKGKIGITDFLKQVKKCSADVYFETTDGDSLVLTSTLSQYIFGTLAAQPDILAKGTIRCKNEEDYELLKDFLIMDEQEDGAE